MTLTLSLGIPFGAARAEALRRVHPVITRMDFSARTLNRLDDLYRVNTHFRVVVDQYVLKFADHLAGYPEGCGLALGADPATDLRWRTARQLFYVWSFLDRAGTMPPWLVLHFSKIQTVAGYPLSDELAARLTAVLDEWIAELDAGVNAVHFEAFFGQAVRTRALFEFASVLERTHHPINWSFRDFFLKKP